ncbi:MAG: Asp-tRNA(Asn)/Glu-tRNA(Gln) amidotransferase subunit GatB [Anaerolineae bacterium]
MKYLPVIGMEVHVELQTASKMFCGCDADPFGAPPNSHVCPVCLALPGALPVINRQAVAYTIMTGQALNCAVQAHNVFARKNYFYPDLPKGYQISQYELPLCRNGWLDIEAGPEGQTRRVRIRRVHLEEDTGKLLHVEGHSLVDLNRAGVPLMEIVSEADLNSADEAYAYVIRLRQIVRYLGVSSGDMEKGAMRCEVNLSLQEPEGGQWGTKVEIKNLNSFRSVRNAIAYEIERQAKVLDAGGAVVQVTMGWDEGRGATVEQRSKEEAHDYRYFPEPDLPPLNLDPAWLEDLRRKLPELPAARQERFMADFGLSRQDASVLAEDRAVADWFESVVEAGQGRVAPKAIANWVTGEMFRRLRESGGGLDEVKVQPEHLVELIELLEAKTINQPAAKETFGIMWGTGRPPEEIVEARGLRQISDAGELEAVARQAIAENPAAVEQYRGGKETVINFLVGQVMRATRGKANPKLAEELLREVLADG